MSVRCDVVIDPSVAFEHAGFLADLLQQASEHEPALRDGAWQMSLRLCDDATISDLHARFFADPSPTDVITFPSDEMQDDDGAYLGDVIVSVETATEQAQDGGHSPEREVAFLALHGLLHLCGYDDANAEQRNAMHLRQVLHLEAWERARGRPW